MRCRRRHLEEQHVYFLSHLSTNHPYELTERDQQQWNVGHYPRQRAAGAVGAGAGAAALAPVPAWARGGPGNNEMAVISAIACCIGPFPFSVVLIASICQ